MLTRRASCRRCRRCHPELAAAARAERGGWSSSTSGGGTLAYFGAYDVHRAQLMGRIAPTTGIAPFTALVSQVMTTEPYASAQRVFWIVDNGSSHAGKASIARMGEAWPTATLVHLPVHASWLNQIEIVFSVIQRKVIKPADFADLDALAAAADRVRTPLQRHRHTVRLALHPRRPRRSVPPSSTPIEHAHDPSAAGRRLNTARMSRCPPRRHPPKPASASGLNARARDRWPALDRVSVRFRGQFAYIDGHLPDGEVMPLCRLRYGGSASSWGFAIYRASHDDYQDNFLPNGHTAGSPEEALDCACGLYLNDPTAWRHPDTPTN